MAVKLKSPAQIEAMKEAGRVSALALRRVGEAVEPGITTAELDAIAEKVIRAEGGIPAFKGYGGFPGSICASVNDAVVHGIPSRKLVLREGDIISIDIPARTITLQVSEEELAVRKAAWVCPEPRIKTGYLARYAKLVTSAARGAVLE